MSIKSRLLVVVLLCAFAFTFGVQWAGAEAAGEGWCDDACDEECGGECDFSQARGCNCFYFCESGESGVEFCAD